jgi:hypothetical protein
MDVCSRVQLNFLYDCKFTLSNLRFVVLEVCGLGEFGSELVFSILSRDLSKC